MPLVATECGYWNADVMGIDEKSAVELEIKISKSDLKADFTKKADKHLMYMNPELTKFTPNKFYFLVTKELEFEAIKLVEEKAPRYGVLVYEEKVKQPKPGLKRKRKRSKTKGLKGEIRLAKKAYNLHENPPSPQLMDNVLTRASSELCRVYIDWQELSDRLDSLQDKEDK